MTIQAFAPTFEVDSQKQTDPAPMGFSARTCVTLAVIQPDGEILRWDLPLDAARTLASAIDLAVLAAEED